MVAVSTVLTFFTCSAACTAEAGVTPQVHPGHAHPTTHPYIAATLPLSLHGLCTRVMYKMYGGLAVCTGNHTRQLPPAFHEEGQQPPRH